MANTKSVILKIRRQLTPDAKPSWEEFEIPYKPNMNVTSALMEIAANPVTYDSNCPCFNTSVIVSAAKDLCTLFAPPNASPPFWTSPPNRI
ncbi:MAG: hypothetical protein WAM89_02255 [Terriglobales bacterium]